MRGTNNTVSQLGRVRGVGVEGGKRGGDGKGVGEREGMSPATVTKPSLT